MAKRQRRRRNDRIIANRRLVIMEKRYARALFKYRRGTARLAAQHREYRLVAEVINSRKPGLEKLIHLWVKRMVELFGKDVIDSIEARKGVVKAPEKRATFDDFVESVVNWIDRYALEEADFLTEALLLVAKDVLEWAFRDGLGEKETAKRLQEEVGGEYWEAARTARTELHTAANVGSDEAARSTGADLVKEWAATDDNRTRISHRDADGQRKEMNEPFSVGGSYLDYPGDPNGPAREVINCRCVVLYHPRINGEVID